MKTRIVMVLLLLGAVHGIGLACPSCYGAADSPMTSGMNMAIIGMLGITGFVLSGISCFFLALMKRSRNLRDRSSGNDYDRE